MNLMGALGNLRFDVFYGLLNFDKYFHLDRAVNLSGS